MAKGTQARQIDIARAAGVSQATVSYVLTGNVKGIPEATRRRVLDAMTELGYVPNVAAQSLRGGRNGLIGVFTFEPVFPVSADDYYHEFLVGIEEQAVEVGLDLTLFTSTQGSDGRRRIYANGTNRLRLADGAVLLGLQSDHHELERLAAEDFPAVYIGRRSDAVGRMPYVSADYDDAVATSLALLGGRGHRRVAYVGSVERTQPTSERLAGYRRHAPRENLESTEPLLIEEAGAGAALDAMLDQGVTGLLVESYSLASALMEASGHRGLSIPADLSMICLDVGAPQGPAATASRIEVPRRALGRRSVAVLLDLLDGVVDRSHHEALPCGHPDPSTVAAPRRLAQRAGS